MTKKILLRNTGRYALIDDDDFELVNSFGAWYENDSGYAVKKTRIKGKNVSIRMHRLVMNPPRRLEVDHINGNRLDNRKNNLRCVSHQINIWNTKRDDLHKKYDLPKGVSYDKSRNKYVATKIIRKRFDTLEEAINFNKESEELDYVRQ